MDVNSALRGETVLGVDSAPKGKKKIVTKCKKVFNVESATKVRMD